jgi:hypothetical protein
MSLADQKQQFWPTFLAFVTALATLLGAVGGIVATAVALSGGGDSPSSPVASPAGASSTPSPAATRSPTPRPILSPKPSVLALAAEADSSWTYPARLSEDEDHLALDWACSRDSRGNGSKQDCGSGLIAVRFDLTALPRGARTEEALLSLYTEDGSGTDIYARLATTQWKEEDTDGPPECDPAGETAGQADGEQWTWDVTSFLLAQLDAGAKDLGVCLFLKQDAGIVFGSREGAPSTAPALTITYR